MGIISAIAMFLIYKSVFKEFKLSKEQAVIGALAFAVLTNPFFYYAAAAEHYYKFKPYHEGKFAIISGLKRVHGAGYGMA